MAYPQGADFVFRPVVQNSAHGEQVGFGQFVAKEIAGHHLDTLTCHRRSAGIGTRSLDYLGQVEDHGVKIGISFASGNRQMAGGAAQVYHSPKSREVEGFHHLG